MDGTLKISSTALAYADLGGTSNPKRRFVDWTVQRSYDVHNPKSEPFTIDPGATQVLFSGARSTSVDFTTQFTTSPSPLSPTSYRFSWTAGTDPVLRAARAVALAGRSVTALVNANGTLTLTSQAGDFSAAQVGDTLLVPGTATGDASSPFDPMNVGYWQVLAVAGDGSSVQLARAPGVAFTGYSQTVSVTSNGQVLVYSAAGVQVGDGVSVSAGFAPPVVGLYQVAAVTSKWFEVVSTSPLPSVAAAPGAAGIQFYTAPKRYVRVEADQPCVLRLNGDTGSSLQVVPWAPADPDNTALVELTGGFWSLSVVNLSSAPLNLLLVSAE